MAWAVEILEGWFAGENLWARSLWVKKIKKLARLREFVSKESVGESLWTRSRWARKLLSKAVRGRESLWARVRS